MKFEDQENPDKGELGDADIKNVIKNVDENQIVSFCLIDPINSYKKYYNGRLSNCWPLELLTYFLT